MAHLFPEVPPLQDPAHWSPSRNIPLLDDDTLPVLYGTFPLLDGTFPLLNDDTLPVLDDTFPLLDDVLPLVAGALPLITRALPDPTWWSYSSLLE